MRALVLLARMVKIEHSVFALPFAYAGSFLAARGWPGWRVFLLVSLAMVAVRSFAMAFNRIADLKFDRENPRTQGRPLVTGEISLPAAWAFTIASAGLFVLACAGLNSLCLALSPVALGLCAFYSLTKRFTWACHFVLGLTLGLAPVAGWIAFEPAFRLPAAALLLAVTFWVAGFDVIYATQDMDFDRERGLHSIPARFGLDAGLALSAFCHVNTSLFLGLAGWSAGLGWPYAAVWALTSVVLAYEHAIVKPDDLTRVNTAFFTLNGFISPALLLGVLLGM
ncbi:MAG: UbiA-like polyprenyltransferase [Thermodesulfobacteriota bacterium]